MSSQRFPPGEAPLERLPEEIHDVIAEFCGDVATVSISEEHDTFTSSIVLPYMNSAGPSTWKPAYNHLGSMALSSRTLYKPAQQALFKLVIISSTGQLMKLLRSLLRYPHNREYVRCFAASIKDHERPFPRRFAKPEPHVLAEFMHYIHPLLDTAAVQGLPSKCFFGRGVPLLQETFQRLKQDHKITLSLLDSTVTNLHTLEDQLITTTLQLMPRVAATRLCFGTPSHDGNHNHELVAVRARMGPPIYASLLSNEYFPRLTSLSLDFGALVALTNLQSCVHGYPAGLPPYIERLTIVGIEKESELHYGNFTMNTLCKWISTNRNLRELRVLHGVDQHIRHGLWLDGNVGIPAKNWNSILLRYRKTLEVFVLESYPTFGVSSQDTFGRSGMLNCLAEMDKLRHLKVPMNALSGEECSLSVEEDDSDITSYMRTPLPPNWQRIDVMVQNVAQSGTGGERMPVAWRTVGFQKKGEVVETQSSDIV